VPGNITAPAVGASAAVTFTVTASDAVDSSPTITCSKNSGSTFAVGTTHVSCSAKDDAGNTSATATFDVTVQDKTAPAISVPSAPVTKEATAAGGAPVTFNVTATDAIDKTPTITCNHASGSIFPIGTTHVSCTAADDAGNTSEPATFDVTVADNTAPSLSVPASFTVGAPGPGGAVVTYTASATDAVDSSPTISCSKASGATFPLGPTLVSCTAKDSANNISGAKTFTVTVADQTPPSVNPHAQITLEATSGSGAAASFVVTASDAIDPSPTVTCTPASGSTFPIGTTHVSCTAKDAANNTSAAVTFDVNVIDTTPPVLSNVPADITVEANGPSGSVVNYTAPTAVDLGQPIVSVPCVPATASTFQLGTTTVNCSASDGRGNTGTAKFHVKVQDTTPPTLNVPGDLSAYAVEDAGTFSTDDSISRFIFGANVSDIADTHPTITHDAPGFFPVGTTTVKFTATDASGNKTSGSAKLTILAKPAPGTTPPPLPPPTDNKPPGPVQSVVAKGGDGRAAFKWTNPSDADFDHTEITRTTSLSSKATGAGTVVYSGKGTTFTDRGLQNGSEYRYVLASVDKSGNKSAGVATVVVPKKAFLKTPGDGIKLKQIPKQFVWLADPKADYYNLQLYLGGNLLFKSTAAEPKKILSTWTTTPLLVFTSPWKWEGRAYKMTNGVYTWYVWPGYGAREANKYGALMGSATFQVTVAAKPKPKPKPKPKKP
jgi:hypothetical protein